ncbi:MAG: hypothetical protein CVU11_00170 [Bacteroidetes bacterium HGW-Bacteroidetes-6]|jgi:hypothetical protein|nr:MAG: hypothetical protein CVU11_00170 [Bacteroidetes bacterium HGW-Bacteroidetes-6]
MRILFIFLLLGWLQLNAQITYSFENADRTARILNDITVLAHDSLMGREGGSEWEYRAGNYIIAEYKKCGLIPVPGTSDFRQPFVIDREYFDNGDSVITVSNNILGYIENNAPYTIIIGGHYDHLGYKYTDDSLLHIYNGADDNASGAASVMEMARYLSSGNMTKYNYILACWGSEEKGLLGSNFFCSSHLYPFDKVAFYVNFDMVGRMGWQTDQLDIYGLGSSLVWGTVVSEENYGKYKLKKLEAAVDASDHTCFNQNRIPFIYFTSGLPPVYHTPKDETVLINPEGVELIVTYTEEIIGRFGGEKPSYRQVTKKEQNKVYWYFFSQMLN